MSTKKTVTNMTGQPIPLSDCTLGVAQTAEVTSDHTVANYLAEGFLVEAEAADDKPKEGKK